MISNVIVTGSLGFDYIMNFNGRFADRIMPDKIHALSLSFLADKLNKQFGGTGGNIAYNLHLLGTRATLLSSAGNDFGPYMDFLNGLGIDTAYIHIVKTVPTSTYFVLTDTDYNQIGSFYVGAMKKNADLPLSKVMAKGDPDAGYFVCISPNDPAAMLNYVTQCNESKIKYLYDPAFQTELFTPGQLKHGIVGAEIVIGNDYEISLMEKKLEMSHEELVLTAGTLITTLASKGSVIETRTQQIHIRPAKPKNQLDPTGAGDAYRAGFIAGYARGFDMAVCGQMGSVAAVYTVEKYGTVTHAYTKADFEKRYFENYAEKIAL
jgi:adenosine kinase